MNQVELFTIVVSLWGILMTIVLYNLYQLRRGQEDLDEDHRRMKQRMTNAMQRDEKMLRLIRTIRRHSS